MFLFKFKKRKKIKAIFEGDLQAYLKKFGIFEYIQRGQAKCAFCGRPVDLESIFGVFPEAGKVRIVCEREKCVSQLKI